MRGCAALNCSNRASRKVHGIAFHSFPKDEERRQLWTKAVGRGESWQPTNSSKLCSAHFPEEMLIRTYTTVRLCQNAVPYILLKSAKNLKMKPKAAATTHIVQVVPAAFDSKRESEQNDESAYENEESDMAEDEDYDVAKDEDCDVAKDKDYDVAEDEDYDMAEDEENDMTEDEENISEEENDPLTEENCTKKIPPTEFVTYVVVQPDKKVPKLSRGYSLVRSNGVHVEDRSKIKDIISNVFKLESQVKIEDDKGNNAGLSRKLINLESELKQIKQERVKDKKKMRALQQSQRRKDRKIIALERDIDELKQKAFAANKSLEMLEEAPPLLLELLNWQRNLNKDNINSRYSVAAREFVKNLHTLSPSAYRQVRNFLISSLPHERTVKKWKSDDSLASNIKTNSGKDNTTSVCIDIQTSTPKKDDERNVSCAENGNLNGQENVLLAADLSPIRNVSVIVNNNT